MSDHAACSPSSSPMWLVCPASVTLTADVPRPSSKFAREGTAAHKVAEMILKGDLFLPDKIGVEGQEFIVSAGMCRALNPYIKLVQALRKNNGRVILEKRIQVPDTEGLVWGTLDCGAYYSGALFVVDLKFGKGHRVEPESPQLKLYALGLAALWGLNESFMDVTLTIVQPRVGSDPIRSHDTTLGALWQWSDFVLRPAVLKIAEGDTTEVAGPHCRWCVRQTECKAYAGRHQKSAADVFGDLP